MKGKEMEKLAKAIKGVGIGVVAVAPFVVTLAKKGVDGTIKVIKAMINFKN
mgnify:CR=1 FL=1